MNLRRPLLFAVLALSFLSTSASAQQFYWNTASAGSTAMGGTYIPSSSNVLDALAANPAGLTYLSGRSLDLDLTSVFARGSFTDSVNNGAPMTTSPGVLPYGAFGMPIPHSRLSFGIGFMPDLMSVSDWRYVDAPGAAGATYGLQEQKSAILAGRMVAGVGYRLSRRISLGATFGEDYNSNTLDAPYIFQSQPVLKGLKTLLDLHTTGFGWNTSAGVLVRPTRKFDLGLAWKSRTIINSTGSATGNAGAQFAALGLSAPAGFTYSAQVHNVLPQSLLASVDWRANSHWTLALEGDWVNWHSAFVTLPVTLTNGTNAAINSLINSSTLVDGVPLNWKDQYTFHAGAERRLTESTSLWFGYAHANNPVPDSTLTPLTAAIMSNDLSTGLAYQHGVSRVELAYSFDPTAQSQVQRSSLLSGEYDNSTVRVGLQSLTLNYSIHF